MKAWLVREKDEFCATVVFADTRGKARAMALLTECCGTQIFVVLKLIDNRKWISITPMGKEKWIGKTHKTELHLLEIADLVVLKIALTQIIAKYALQKNIVTNIVIM